MSDEPKTVTLVPLTDAEIQALLDLSVYKPYAYTDAEKSAIGKLETALAQ